MRRVDAVHRRAEALAVAEADDELVGVILGEAVDHVDFRAHGPFAAGRGGGDGLADEVGRACKIGLLHDLKAALGVDDDFDAGELPPGLIDVLGTEELVDGAVPFPEEEGGVADLFVRQPPRAAGLLVIPRDHGLKRETHLVSRVAPKVLIGEEDDFGFGVVSGQWPVVRLNCVAAVPSPLSPLPCLSAHRRISRSCCWCIRPRRARRRSS